MEWSVGYVSGTPPSARSRHSGLCLLFSLLKIIANLLGNKLFIFGGGDDRKLFNDLFCLETSM